MLIVLILSVVCFTIFTILSKYKSKKDDNVDANILSNDKAKDNKHNFKKIIVIIFWYFFIVYVELILRAALFNNFFSISIFNILLFSIPISLICYLITNIFPYIINKIITYVILISLTIVFIAQIIYYKTYSSIFSIYSMGKADQIFEFYDTIIKMIIKNIIYILLLLIPIILYIIVSRHNKSSRLKFIKSLILIPLIIIIHILCVYSLDLYEKNSNYSPKNLYYNVHSPTLSVNKLGLITTMRLDTKKIIFGFQEKSNLSIVNNKEKTNVVEEKYEYNVMDIDFNTLIANETDQSIKDMDTYFKNATPTQKNKYTGMFEGKNLIYFIAESFHPIAVDPILTPTLYKLTHEGFVFNNYYQPLFPISTSDGEYMADTSLLPKEGVWSGYKSSTIYMPFTLGNELKSLGYKTTAYHDHVYTYYYRYKFLPNYGYDYYACGQGLNINCNSWPESDIEMIESTYNQYINEDHFMTYYITVSGHLSYSRVKNAIVRKNWNYVKDLSYSEAIKSYLAGNIELDRALENLINHLKEVGKLKDTVIALTADHYPYGLTLDEMNEISKTKLSEPFDEHKSNFILWNSEIPTVKINKHVSSLDILPTLLNLFGMKYDSRLLMGNDMLSEDPGLVIFSNRSFISDVGIYNSIDQSFKGFDGKDVSNEYISNMNKIIYDKFYLSKKILETDYYKKIFK